jgi:hypothetical protein
MYIKSAVYCDPVFESREERVVYRCICVEKAPAVF